MCQGFILVWKPKKKLTLKICYPDCRVSLHPSLPSVLQMTGSVAAQSSRRVGGSVRRSYDLWLVYRKIKIKCDWFGENDGLRRSQWTHCG